MPNELTELNAEQHYQSRSVSASCNPHKESSCKQDNFQEVVLEDMVVEMVDVENVNPTGLITTAKSSS